MRTSIKHCVGMMLAAVAVLTGLLAVAGGAAGASQVRSQLTRGAAHGLSASPATIKVKVGTYHFFFNGKRAGTLYVFATDSLWGANKWFGWWSQEGSVIGLSAFTGTVFAAKVSGRHLGTKAAPGEATLAGSGSTQPWYATFESSTLPVRPNLPSNQGTARQGAFTRVLQRELSDSPGATFPGTYTIFFLRPTLEFEGVDHFEGTAFWYAGTGLCDKGSYLSFAKTIVMSDNGCETITSGLMFLWMAKELKKNLGSLTEPGLLDYKGTYFLWIGGKS